MGEDSGYASVGVIFQVGKELAIRLGHGLYLQSENTQAFQYRLHTLGNHTQILGTYEHMCGSHQFGQNAHGMLFPEVVVTFVEVVMMYAPEGFLLLCRECTEYEFVFCSYAGVIALLFVFIA